MSKTLTFQFCKDTRFTDNPEKWINDKTETLLNKFKDLVGVTIKTENTRRIDFNDCVSYRKRFYVNKNTRSLTWNNIFEIVNSVSPQPYDFI